MRYFTIKGNVTLYVPFSGKFIKADINGNYQTANKKEGDFLAKHAMASEVVADKKAKDDYDGSIKK